MSMRDLTLYLVAGAGPDVQQDIAAAIHGGVTMVQIRFKSLSDRDLIDLAEPVMELCKRHQIPVIVNDRLDLALVLNADGVHLGVDDLPLESASEMSPEGFHIGYSPESDEQIRTAAERGATYLGIGSVYTTTTKLDAGAALGLEEFHRRCELTTLPVVGIGGITSG
ncbi:MAG: thiamine phosphate synthase, partial [Thermomicrobiales bacterium]